MTLSAPNRSPHTPRPRRSLGAVTAQDFDRLRQLRRMQGVAVGLLVGMAVVFVVSFALQDRVPWLGFVRAAAEGGMVGALADWFAVTALFRHPLGLKIPHTNLIARKKDDIGANLGDFIEQNFLSDEVVHAGLAKVSGARMAGRWLETEENAERLSQLIAEAGLGALTVLDDTDVQELLEGLVREHVIDPEWGPLLGSAVGSLVADGHHQAMLDIVADRAAGWLRAHPRAFDRFVSARMPSWVPGVVDRFVDARLHAEAVRFVEAVATDRAHPFRAAATKFLADLGTDLQEQAELQGQLEQLKHEIFDSPRVRALAVTTWDAARTALVSMLEDPGSDLRVRIRRAVRDFGRRLREDATLQYKIDVWVIAVVEHLVQRYRHDIVAVVTDTVERWDAHEAAEKIELQVGKDLQFIRINGTVVGALAGLAIFAVATFVITPLTH